MKQIKDFIVPHKKMLTLVFAVLILFLNFMTNFLDSKNIYFKNFDYFSDTLVSGTIYAEHYGIQTHQSSLGRFNGILGEMYSYEPFFTDEYWNKGYGRNPAQILIRNTDFTKKLFQIGHSVEFPNGDEFRIVYVHDWGSNLAIHFDTEKLLSQEKNGSLSDIKVKDEDGKYLELGEWIPYFSQYGLQGKIFRRIASLFDFEIFPTILHIICSFLSAVVFVLISYFIYKKFDFLFGIIFYVVFLSSPWVVNFARNLYWCEFTFFLPMLCGLICSYKQDNFKIRIICYFSAFLTLFIKSLCGYEFLSTIMISLVMFPLYDFIMTLFQKDSVTAKRKFMDICLLGFAAVLGFIVAFVIHTYHLGNGNFSQGFEKQIHNAIRRLSGSNLISFISNLHGREFEAVFASRLETLFLYFVWNTQIVTGIDGNLFPLLCFTAVATSLTMKNKTGGGIFMAISFSYSYRSCPQSHGCLSLKTFRMFTLILLLSCGISDLFRLAFM